MRFENPVDLTQRVHVAFWLVCIPHGDELDNTSSDRNMTTSKQAQSFAIAPDYPGTITHADYLVYKAPTP